MPAEPCPSRLRLPEREGVLSDKGQLLPPEWSEHWERATGTRVVQLTSANAISHPSYFLQSSFLPGDDALFFTSYRTGTPQLWLVSLKDGTLRQVTDGPGIHPFSPAWDEHRDELVF